MPAKRKIEIGETGRAGGYLKKNSLKQQRSGRRTSLFLPPPTLSLLRIPFPFLLLLQPVFLLRLFAFYRCLTFPISKVSVKILLRMKSPKFQTKRGLSVKARISQLKSFTSSYIRADEGKIWQIIEVLTSSTTHANHVTLSNAFLLSF